jgi:hypothetical protein
VFVGAWGDCDLDAGVGAGEGGEAGLEIFTAERERFC